MALIKCPECGREISDKAAICPGCGYPFSEHPDNKNEELIGVSVGDSTVLYFNDRTLEIERYGKIIEKDDLSNFCISRTVKDSKPAILIRHISKSLIIVINVGKKEDQLRRLLGYAKNDKSNTGFDGVYRRLPFGKGLKEVYCPFCGSSNCSHHQDKKIISGKTKTTYTANLNPFKPFTLVNKKEKVLRKEQVITEDNFLCNNCGEIFY